MANKETSAMLKHHVEVAVALIQRLKNRNSSLESEHRVLVSENERLKQDAQQHDAVVASYEEKMKTLETLLNEAQSEQNQLEHSILNAINSLGIVESDFNEKDSSYNSERAMRSHDDITRQTQTVSNSNIESETRNQQVSANNQLVNSTFSAGAQTGIF